MATFSRYLAESVSESPVALLLTEVGDRRNAMTVSFFSEVAHHPTTLWVAVEKQSYTCELIERSHRFSLAVLHEKQSQFARLCGTSSGRERDKLIHIPIHRTVDDFLFLDDAISSVACKVRSATDIGDHTLYIADILHAETDTLAFMRRHLLTVDLI